MAKEENQKKSNWPLYISLALVVITLGLYFLVPPFQDFIDEAYQVLSSGDEKKISQWVDQFGWWGPLVLILSMTVQMVVLVVPTILVMIVSVLAYGPILGSGIILAGIFIASSLAYALGYSLGTLLIENFIGRKKNDKVKGFLNDYGFWAIIVVRFSPFLSNDVISLVAGIMKMGYWRFIGATMLGIFPLTVLIAYLGKNIERMESGLIWLGGLSIVGFIVYVIWDKKRK